jgi:hypothetical protein
MGSNVQGLDSRWKNRKLKQDREASKEDNRQTWNIYLGTDMIVVRYFLDISGLATGYWILMFIGV